MDNTFYNKSINCLLSFYIYKYKYTNITYINTSIHLKQEGEIIKNNE